MNDSLNRTLNKLAKWRTVLAGWQLGTRPKGDPECDAVRDHRELTILLRAEVSALVGILISTGVVTEAEWDLMLEKSALEVDKVFEQRFPGFSTYEDGVKMDVKKAAQTMKGWRP